MSLQLVDKTTGALTPVAGNGVTAISDATKSFDRTWSSNKINGELSARDELGAKNLLPNNAVSQTINGITYTINSDGSITANGTATDTYYLPVIEHFEISGNLILNGCPSGGSSSTYELQVRSEESDPSQWQVAIDHGNGATLSASNTRRYSCFVGIMSGQTVTNLLFKPMIRLASIADDTYVPYAMTNREMTPYVKAISNPNLLDNPWFTINQRGSNNYTADGYCVDRWYELNANVAVSSSGVTLTQRSGMQYAPIIRQMIEPHPSIIGKLITFSINVTSISGGTAGININKCNGVNSGLANIVFTTFDTPGIHQIHAIIPDDVGGSTYPFIHVGIDAPSSGTMTIKSTKLEIGEISTLAMDTAPNYTTELLKCQRYFYRINNGTQNNYPSVSGYTASATAHVGCFKLPTIMRTKPTVSKSTGLKIRIMDSTGIVVNDKEPTSLVITPSGNNDYGCIIFNFSAGDSTSAGILVPVSVVMTGSNNASEQYIDLSADL